MTPVFRAGMIVEALNRHLAVFGHRIECLKTKDGKIVGSRGARRWRAGTGTGPCYGTCQHCQEEFEIFYWSSGLNGTLKRNRYMVSLKNMQSTFKMNLPTRQHILFYLIENEKGFHLDENTITSSLTKRRQENTHFVCKRVRAFL